MAADHILRIIEVLGIGDRRIDGKCAYNENISIEGRGSNETIIALDEAKF